MSPFPFLALLSILAGGALAHSIHGAKYGACCQRALFELRQPTSEISGEYLVVYSAYWDAISVIMIMEIEETLCEIPVPVYLADLTNPGIAMEQFKKLEIHTFPVIARYRDGALSDWILPQYTDEKSVKEQILDFLEGEKGWAELAWEWAREAFR